LDQTIADEISGVQLPMAAAHDNLVHRRTRLVPLDHPEHGNESGRKMSAQNPKRFPMFELWNSDGTL
jgi:hypothetical protein